MPSAVESLALSNFEIHSLQYKIKDNELFLLSHQFSRENQQLIKVHSINDFHVGDILKKIEIHSHTIHNIADFLRKHHVIKDDHNVVAHIEDRKVEIDINKLNTAELNTIFYKRHDKADILKNLEAIPGETFYNLIEDKQLEYACDSAKKLVKILYELSCNQKDKIFFNELYKKHKEMFKINLETEDTLNWIIISSLLLFVEKDLLSMPYYVYERELVFNLYECYLLDQEDNVIRSFTGSGDEIGCNSYIFDSKTGKLKPKTLFKSIRNAFAHSQYEIIDSSYVKVYTYHPTEPIKTFNVIINQRLIKEMINQIFLYSNLNNIFPMLVNKDNERIYRRMKNKKDVINFLNGSQIVDSKSINFKEYMDKIGGDFFPLHFSEFCNHINIESGYIKDKTNIYRGIEHVLKGYVDIDLEEKEVGNQDYILARIDKYGETFYKHSIQNQQKILSEIIRTKILSEKSILNTFGSVIQAENKAVGGLLQKLDDTPTSYIDYTKYIEITLIAYLNALFLYGHDSKAYSEVSECSFTSMKLNTELMIKANQNRIENIKRENKNINKELDKAEKRISQFEKNVEDLKKAGRTEKAKEIEEVLLQVQNTADQKNKKFKVKKQENEKRIAESEADIRAIENKQYNNFKCFKGMRNSLAHGDISFPYGLDFDNIINTVIKFENYYPGTNHKTFSGEIVIKDLLRDLIHEKTIKCIRTEKKVLSKTKN
jgi:hypothetical protein